MTKLLWKKEWRDDHMAHTAQIGFLHLHVRQRPADPASTETDQQILLPQWQGLIYRPPFPHLDESLTGAQAYLERWALQVIAHDHAAAAKLTPPA